MIPLCRKGVKQNTFKNRQNLKVLLCENLLRRFAAGSRAKPVLSAAGGVQARYGNYIV